MITLKKHQQEAVDFFDKKTETEKGVLFLDEVGVGKTFPALEILRRNEEATQLYVCPAYLVDVIAESFDMFGLHYVALKSKDSRDNKKLKIDY